MHAYSTHLEALIKTAVTTTGDILELGCGDYSTLQLVAICEAQGRKYRAQASNREWASRYGDLIEIVTWQGWKPPINDNSPDGKWGFVFLDSEESVADRIKRLPALAEVTDIVVMHDANIAMANPNWEKMAAPYNKVTVYNRFVPHTVVMRC